MTGPESEIIVGVLGQWASGKTSAAGTLLGYLGGEGRAVFIGDRELLARQAVNHILQLEDSQVRRSIEGNGRQRLDGEHATVWLGPGEDLRSVDLRALQFDVDHVVMPRWLSKARLGLGHQICEKSGHGKPIVVEAAFGRYPVDHTISDLFMRLEEAGVEPRRVKWILVEASWDTRSQRNQKRPIGTPQDVFEAFAADGGDLVPEQQEALEKQGVVIKRIRNDHDDIGRFRADIVAAFDEMFGDVSPGGSVDESQKQA